MKSKLRKIIIENLVYLYSVVDHYDQGIDANTLTVKVFLDGYKQTPLLINFTTREHCYQGQVLKSGVDLPNTITKTVDRININEPKYMRQLILQGLKSGWTGNNKIKEQNGLTYLEMLGYEIDALKG